MGGLQGVIGPVCVTTVKKHQSIHIQNKGEIFGTIVCTSPPTPNFGTPQYTSSLGQWRHYVSETVG